MEYANTVRDLFYFKEFKADDLPPDDLGYGFNNIADLLSVSPNQLELYLKTAEQAIAQLDATAKPSPNWAKNDQTYWEPDDGVSSPSRTWSFDLTIIRYECGKCWRRSCRGLIAAQLRKKRSTG